MRDSQPASSMWKRFIGVAVASLVLAPAVALAPAASAAPGGDNVVINELYARGGSANQPYTHKFVELYNPTDEPIDLEGWTLQYKSATGASFGVQATLSGVIPAEGYFLVQGGSNGTTGGDLPEADIVANGLNPGGSNGVVALVEGDAAISLIKGDISAVENDALIDLIGTGTADTYETAAAANQGGASDPLSWQRTDFVDTDDNSSDFSMLAPTPTNSGGDTGGGDPGPREPIEIAEIQGAGDATPIPGTTAITHGVVTGVYPEGGFNGVFIQTPGTGGEHTDETSHGIFVYGGSTNVLRDIGVGDYIEVTGTVSEYFGLTQIAAISYQILDDDVEPVTAAIFEMPADEAYRERFESMLVAPQGEYTVSDTYHTNRFGWLGLAAGGTPLVQPTDVARPGSAEALTIEADNRLREIRMDDGSSFDYTNFNFDDHEIPVPYLSNDTNAVRVGAAVTFERPVILDFRRTVANQDSTWNFQPQTRLTGANADHVQPISWTSTRPAAPEAVGGDVTLATFNVLNYFTSLGVDEPGCDFYGDRQGGPTTARNCGVRGAYDVENRQRQEEKIVNAILALGADIVGLQEIENSAPFQSGDRDVALGFLVDLLNAEAGAGVWNYVPSPGETPGAGEDVIRTAFIYRTAAVEPRGESAILLGDAAFGNAREPLAQEFALVGDDDAKTFVVINNHFKSKGSGSGPGNDDIGDGQGASNADRVAQANALLAFANEQAADAETELIFLLGDFNSYTHEDPLQVFYQAGFVNVGQTLTDKSTYSFGSMVGSLDHVFASEAAAELVTGADIWNINAYESIGLEYSRYNYNVTPLVDGSLYRSSDHDPIVVGIALASEPDDGTDPDDGTGPDDDPDDGAGLDDDPDPDDGAGADDGRRSGIDESTGADMTFLLPSVLLLLAGAGIVGAVAHRRRISGQI